jgi:uncharacterized protein YjiS (DUF1127 family)
LKWKNDMTTPIVRPAVARLSTANTRPVAAMVALLVSYLHASLAQRRSRRDLNRLLLADQRMLDDIGVTRDAVFRELDGL